MSESNESVIWKIIGIGASAGAGVWAVFRYYITGRKKENYEGEKVKEETVGIKFRYYQEEIEYLKRQVLELRTENMELKRNEITWSEKFFERGKIIDAQKEQIDHLMQHIENLSSDLQTEKLKAGKHKTI